MYMHMCRKILCLQKNLQAFTSLRFSFYTTYRILWCNFQTKQQQIWPESAVTKQIKNRDNEEGAICLLPREWQGLYKPEHTRLPATWRRYKAYMAQPKVDTKAILAWGLHRVHVYALCWQDKSGIHGDTKFRKKNYQPPPTDYNSSKDKIKIARLKAKKQSHTTKGIGTTVHGSLVFAVLINVKLYIEISLCGVNRYNYSKTYLLCASTFLNHPKKYYGN